MGEDEGDVDSGSVQGQGGHSRGTIHDGSCGGHGGGRSLEKGICFSVGEVLRTKGVFILLKEFLGMGKFRFGQPRVFFGGMSFPTDQILLMGRCYAVCVIKSLAAHTQV